MINFKQYINKSNIDKIKEECKKINSNIDYSSSDWEEEFINNADWRNISIYQKNLSEDFIEYFKEYVYWHYISEFQKLSESFIEKYKDKVNWNIISKYQNLSESFIEKNKDYVNWDLISEYKKLSESFIEKNKDKVYWYLISKYQNLSESFIEKYKDKINFHNLFHNDNLSNEFILNHINWFINKNIKDSWRFNDKEFENKFYRYKKLFGN